MRWLQLQVLYHISRKKYIVDDTLNHDEDLAQHWWRTLDLLTFVGNSGIVLNPEKFQFAQKEVDFVCFPIMSYRIDLLPKYFSTISNLPTSASTTDLRSWFGLVNHVSN